jgi:hypothetical protein
MHRTRALNVLQIRQIFSATPKSECQPLAVNSNMHASLSHIHRCVVCCRFGLDEGALDRLERIFTEPGAHLPATTPGYDGLRRKLAVDLASSLGGDVDPYAAQNIIGLDFDLFASERVWSMAAKRCATPPLAL